MERKIELYFFTISAGQAIPALSHTDAWIAEFSTHFSKVNVLATHVSTPKNWQSPKVNILEIGGGNLSARLRAVLKLLSLIPRIIRNRRNIVSFFHMSTKALLIVGPFFKIMNIPITLWYSHKVAPFSLRILIFILDIAFSPTTKTFPLNTKKLKATGHGLALNSCTENNKGVNSRNYDSISVLGRVARVKRIENIIFAVSKCQNPRLEVECIGSTDDEKYLNYLRELSTSLSVRLCIRGPMSRSDLMDLLNSRSIVFSGTEGSVDKAPLEAAAKGCFIVTTNSELDELSGMKKFWIKSLGSYDYNLSLESKLNSALDSQTNENARYELAEYSRNRNKLSNLIRLMSTEMVILRELK